ncbi:MAG TPA: PFL family protein [Candidatus Lokiarchaeia archaeon]|nr:PFL family protein [Candidatus Lokiarchaeia archaeon]
MESYSALEILETKRMIEEQGLDVRTITMGINLLDCVDASLDGIQEKIRKKITCFAQNLTMVAKSIEDDFGIPIVNRRIAVTPVSLLLGALPEVQAIQQNGTCGMMESEDIVPSEAIDACVAIARTLDTIAKELDVDFLGGFSSLVHKGFTKESLCTIRSLPAVMAATDRVCASVNVGTTRDGMNMDAVRIMGEVVHNIAVATADQNSVGCAKLVVFTNAVDDNPFMAGAFHGVGEPECCINVGVSGPGVMRNVVSHQKGVDFETLAEAVKKTAFKITRVGQLVAREASRRLSVPFGIVDLSLAPTPRPYDSVAGILEEMGLETTGGPGTTAALALLTDAVKKGGLMASSYVGGLSGAFIPVSEDAGMTRAAEAGVLTIDKLEAMTAVCSVGLDMILIPGSTAAATIAGIIADEGMIGIVNSKTAGVRLIPVIGKDEGEHVSFGGLLGESVVMPVKKTTCDEFIRRGGRIPAPIHSYRN